ncbi:uncharacterized protein [Aegilops tauschii subsp. strangulata]|uniref:uncharacterized protein n=1 Tax=Aegilops tauschii subsp. strangulata TaxID=200361 RepID=UPI00098BA907|nr:uncharacterized protein LOC109759043 [Aegilops tauschii subsp. strangulata]
MDGLVDACKVPCIYKSFGCERYVDQHSLAEHSSRCAHAPYYCYECTPPFEGSLSLEDHRHLLVTEEDGSVFHLAMGTGKARVGRRPVSVVCVMGNTADADTRPVYRCVLTVTAPPRYEGAHAASITLIETVPSCCVPGNVDMEDAWYDFHPKMVHGDSKAVHLVICITKPNVHH